MENNDNALIEQEYFNELGIKSDRYLSYFEGNKKAYKRIDTSLIGRIESVVQIIPSIIQGVAYSSDTYRVIYDKGLGVLQKAANNPGMYRANIVSSETNNAIQGQALLQKVSAGPQIISGVFSAMSLVTGQYYMSQINSRLNDIEKSITEIQKFLEDDKRSHMESEEEFLKGIQKNYQVLIDNDNMRTATLCNIQRIKMDSLANINFYKKQIGDLEFVNAKKDKVEDVFRNIEKINYLISEYWYSLYLYCFASYLEPVIGKNYDEVYIKYVKDDMYEKCTEYKVDYKTWNSMIEIYLDAAKAFDDNKFISFFKSIGDHRILLGSFGLYATGVLAKKADSLDKKKKQKQKDKVFEQLKASSCSNIAAIEAKQDDLMLFNSLYNRRLEIVKDKGEMYIKID